MALLLAEARKLSNNQLEMGVVEEVIDKEDLFAVLPFKQVNGKAYVYTREDVDSFGGANGKPNVEGTFKAVNDTIDEAAAQFVSIVTTLKILIGDVDVDKFLAATQSDTNSQKAIQIAERAKGLARRFKRALIQGDTATDANSFDGLTKIVATLVAGYNDADGKAVAADATRTITAATNGASLTLGMLDQLLDAVPNGADAIFMPRAALRALRAQLRLAGGVTPYEMMLPNFGAPVITHNGVPILISDFIPTNETQGTAVGTTTSIYAVRLNEVDGLHAIYGGGTAGIVVEDIGTVQNKDATRTRLKWYVGLALKSSKSVARLRGVIY